MRYWMRVVSFIAMICLCEATAHAQGSRINAMQAVQQEYMKTLAELRQKQADLQQRLSDQMGLKRRAEAGAAAKDPKIADENRRAVGIAQQAITLTEKVLDIINRRIKRFSRLSEAYKRLLIGEGEPATVAEIKGEGYIRGADGTRRALTEKEMIHPGDVVSTRRGGEVIITLNDGSHIQIKENSAFELGDGCSQKLEKGSLHFLRLATKTLLCEKRTINAPGARGAVRGTEFDLAVEENGLSRFTLYDGAIDISVEKETEPGKVDRWWEKEAKEEGKDRMKEDELIFVSSVSGDVKVQGGKDAPQRAVSAGYLLKPGEILATGAGAAHVILQNSFSGTIGGQGAMQATFKKDSRQPIYLIQKGLVHIKASEINPQARPVILTPNTVINADKGEFDIRVQENGVATMTPYAGSLTMQGFMGKLDETMIERWWDEMYR